MIDRLSRQARTMLRDVLWHWCRSKPPRRIAELQAALAVRRAHHLPTEDVFKQMRAIRHAALRAELGRG